MMLPKGTSQHTDVLVDVRLEVSVESVLKGDSSASSTPTFLDISIPDLPPKGSSILISTHSGIDSHCGIRLSKPQIFFSPEVWHAFCTQTRYPIVFSCSCSGTHDNKCEQDMTREDSAETVPTKNGVKYGSCVVIKGADPILVILGAGPRQFLNLTKK
jgi:hypothetical protein